MNQIKAFISYSHRDEQLRVELEHHLSALRREGVISLWHDRQISAGEEWNRSIDVQLENADLVLLLVSADFLSSEYCWGIEMKRALERQEAGTALVVPIILRAVDWTSMPFGKLQALPPSGMPVTSWSNTDEALLSIANGLREAITAFKKRALDNPQRSREPNPAAGIVDTQSVEITIANGDVLSTVSDVLVVKYAQNLYGVDRAVAHALLQSDIHVPLGEYKLLLGSELVKASWIVFAGVQPLIYFDYDAIERFAHDTLHALSNRHIDIHHVTMTLHGPGYGLDERECLYALLRGLQGAIRNGYAPTKLRRVTIVEQDRKRFGRLLQYLQVFASEGIQLRDPPRFDTSRLKIRTDNRDGKTVQPRSDRERGQLAFVAMPLGEQFEDVYYLGIQPAAHSNSLLCERVDAVSFKGDIVERIRVGIESATVVIADLTSANPYVYFEIGYAWAFRKPTILIARQGEELRFDVRSQRCIFFNTIRKLQELLQEEIRGLIDTR